MWEISLQFPESIFAHLAKGEERLYRLDGSENRLKVECPLLCWFHREREWFVAYRELGYSRSKSLGDRVERSALGNGVVQCDVRFECWRVGFGGDQVMDDLLGGLALGLGGNEPE